MTTNGDPSLVSCMSRLSTKCVFEIGVIAGDRDNICNCAGRLRGFNACRLSKHPVTRFYNVNSRESMISMQIISLC